MASLASTIFALSSLTSFEFVSLKEAFWSTLSNDYDNLGDSPSSFDSKTREGGCGGGT